MNGFVKKATLAAVLACGLGSAASAQDGGGGGWRYRNFVDPCWPERYNFAARQSVLATFGAQVMNGHVLDQTVWNWYFEEGTDKLNPAGYEKLDSLARRRPGPDVKVYLQTSRDLGVSAENVEKLQGVRADLDMKRANAVQKYLLAQRLGPPLPWEIYVHDPSDPSVSSIFASQSWRSQILGYRGNLSIGGGLGTTATGGGLAPGVSPGTGR